VPCPTIYVDADACPNAIKQILFRTAKRRELKTVLVANGSMRIPNSPFIEMITVKHGADIADHKIVELTSAGDLVITDDIPLAARVVKRGAMAISNRGQLFDDDSVHQRLAARDLMDQLRAAGMETGGPKPQAAKDVREFANQLDRVITRLIKRGKSSNDRA
jgi:uncharacterized protein YaiI (UPF0178 family)